MKRLRPMADSHSDAASAQNTSRRLPLIEQKVLKGSLPRFRAPSPFICLSFFALAMLGIGVLAYITSSATSSFDTTPGHGGMEMAAAGQIFCGTPLATFQHFGVADATGKLMNNAPMPTQAQLAQIPKPDPAINPNSMYAQDYISYDAATNQLCANGWSPLYTRFVRPQPAVQGSTNYNPNQPFTSNNPLGVNLNPADWASQAVTGLWNAFWMGTVNFFQHDIIDWALSFGFMYQTPKALSYQHPVVVNGLNWTLSLTGGLLAIVLLIGGYNIIIGQQTGQSTASAMQFMARTMLFTIGAYLGFQFLLPQIVELNNTMCAGAFTILLNAAKGDMTLPLGAINWINQPVTWSLFILIDVVFSILLVFIMLVRLALLDVLIIIGPLAILCFAIPQLASIGRFWLSTFFCTLFVQFLQVATLALGSALIAGFGTASSTPITIFVGIATLYLAMKWTSMLQSHAIRGSMGAVHRDIVSTYEQIGGLLMSMAA